MICYCNSRQNLNNFSIFFIFIFYICTDSSWEPLNFEQIKSIFCWEERNFLMFEVLISKNVWNSDFFRWLCCESMFSHVQSPQFTGFETLKWKTCREDCQVFISWLGNKSLSYSLSTPTSPFSLLFSHIQNLMYPGELFCYNGVYIIWVTSKKIYFSSSLTMVILQYLFLEQTISMEPNTTRGVAFDSLKKSLHFWNHI